MVLKKSKVVLFNKTPQQQEDSKPNPARAASLIDQIKGRRKLQDSSSGGAGTGSSGEDGLA